MIELVLATNNMKKHREIAPLLAELGVTLKIPRDFGVDFDPEETGATFLENARIKAQAALDATGRPALADDSGLEVDALLGAPGVHSARYGAPDAHTDADRVAHLLRAMEGMSDRRARFVCQLCCLFPDGRRIEVFGTCEGEILGAPRGEGGFGYDPVFFLPEREKTMAELTLDEKNTLSHRARALEQFLAAWRGREIP